MTRHQPEFVRVQGHPMKRNRRVRFPWSVVLLTASIGFVAVAGMYLVRAVALQW